MQKLTFKNKQAFTLIELLIVIAIIGILFIVLMSKVDFAADKAKATGVQTDFRSFQLALEMVSQEHSGFNTFGWNTGDNASGIAEGEMVIINGRTYTYTNAAKDAGDRLRNAYDIGDTNLNGIMDPSEVWTGEKVYTENWTNCYTLINPADPTDPSAVVELERAINSNLDPRLHITIDYETGKITMANGAQDPWNTQYHGQYITNASDKAAEKWNIDGSTGDNMDRGAIVIYSNGINQQFGTKVKIEKGVVTAVVSMVDANTPDSNKQGADDYVLSVVYSYTNGYGEIGNATWGFSNNQEFLAGNGGELENLGNNDANPGHTTIQTLQPGLYASGSNYTQLLHTWEELISMNVIDETGRAIGNGKDTDAEQYVIDELSGDLIWPEELTRVPAYAFKNCINLTDIKLHKEVTELGKSSFQNSGLIHFTVPEKVTELNHTFRGSPNLQTVDIHDEVNYIYYAFGDCVSLIEAYIPEGISIVEGDYEGCSSLTTVYIPSTVKKISGAMFWNCTKLNNVYFAGTLEQWLQINMDGWDYFGSPFHGDNSTLYIDNQPVVDVIVPESITLFKGSFAYCDSIKSVTFHNNMTEVGQYSFYGCKNLETIYFSDSITKIGDWAFRDCANLKSLNLPSNLEIISSNAFEDTYIDGTIVIPNSVKSIGTRAFSYTRSIIQWDAKNSQLESIGANAFYRTTFNDLVIPDSMTTLDGSAFNEAYYTTLHIGKNLQTLKRDGSKWGPFHDNARYFESITVDPENPYYKVDGNCLIDVRTNALVLGTKHSTIPNYVTTIEDYAFFNCYGLQSIVIPDTCTKIEAYAFFNCTNLKDVVIGSNVVNIGYAAFNKCAKLETVEINAITPPTLGEYVFGGCDKLTNIYTPFESVSAYKVSWDVYGNRISYKTE